MRASTCTVEQAIQQTGISNVFMAGGLSIDEHTLAIMPSATRIICKDRTVNRPTQDPKDAYFDLETAANGIFAAKRLAAKDTRVEACFFDDFNTTAMDGGASPEHLAKLQFANVVSRPYLPVYVCMYTMQLERPGIAEMLRYFDQIEIAVWDLDQLDTLPAAIDRCDELSGNKPLMFCVYFYDFGGQKEISGKQMQQQLDMVEALLKAGRVAGVLFCGTCLLDVGLESVECFFDWIKQVGRDTLPKSLRC